MKDRMTDMNKRNNETIKVKGERVPIFAPASYIGDVTQSRSCAPLHKQSKLDKKVIPRKTVRGDLLMSTHRFRR